MSDKDTDQKPHDRRDDGGKDDKPDPAMMVLALIGIGIFMLLTVVYAAGQHSQQSAERSAEDTKTAQRNQLLREWMSTPAKPAK